jgi:predicted ribosome quality control (RQC) complex YloA/Tae2 family protein
MISLVLSAHYYPLPTKLSKAAPSGVVPVSMVRARQVKKPQGAKAGLVHPEPSP